MQGGSSGLVSLLLVCLRCQEFAAAGQAKGPELLAQALVYKVYEVTSGFSPEA